MSSRAQVLKALNVFLDEHQRRCPDPHLETTHQDATLTESACPTCGVKVTRTRHREDWSATWHWPERDATIFHPGGCPTEPRAHTHDENGDVQLSLVP